ncbi:TcpQ domain-containing protein [Bordetella sp. FB-8]|uniref:TcpQ domain-containing protein n=1 Tax=Bordetella sp. FB-8 TaxID=1159870 RepID=UPI00039D6EDF|nr:TcpQ domain-containing protein [Bordetella sp. FB-8]
MNSTRMAASSTVAFIFLGVLAGCGFTPKEAPMPDAANAVPVNRVEPDTRPWTEIYPPIAARAPSVTAAPVTVATASARPAEPPAPVIPAHEKSVPDAKAKAAKPIAKATSPVPHDQTSARPSAPNSLPVPIPEAPADVAAIEIKRSAAVLASAKGATLASVPTKPDKPADPAKKFVPTPAQWGAKRITESSPSALVASNRASGAKQLGEDRITQSLTLDAAGRDPILMAATASVQIPPEEQESGLLAGAGTLSRLASKSKLPLRPASAVTMPGPIVMRDFTPSEKLHDPVSPITAPTKPLSPDLTWSASAGMSLSDALRNWGEQATPHWAIVWNTSEDFRIGAPFTIQAPKFLDAACQLLAAARREHHTYTVISHPNHVLVVTTPTE